MIDEKKIEGLKNATAEVTLQTIISKERNNLLVKNRITKEPIPEDFRSIVKVSKFYAAIGWPYEAIVNKFRKKEGLTSDFESGKLPDGSYREGSQCVIDTDKGAKVQMIMEPGSEPLSVEYRSGISGKVLTYDEIKDYLPAKGTNKSQGLKDPVKVITPYASSIIDLKVQIVPSLIGYLKSLLGVV